MLYDVNQEYKPADSLPVTEPKLIRELRVVSKNLVIRLFEGDWMIEPGRKPDITTALSEWDFQGNLVFRELLLTKLEYRNGSSRYYLPEIGFSVPISDFYLLIYYNVISEGLREKMKKNASKANRAPAYN